VREGARVTVSELGFADILRPPQGRMDETPTLARGARYRAPEQARARAVTRHADVYAVGAILFEALSGSALPESGSDSGPRIAGRPAVDERERALVARGVEAPLRELIARCLERKPWNRYDTATEAREALESAREAIEQAGPIGQARLGEIAWGEPRSEPATRETARPGDASTSGLLDSRAWAMSTPDPSQPDVVLQNLEPVAPIARILGAGVRREQRAWWLVLAAALVVGVGVAVALWATRGEVARDEGIAREVERFERVAERAVVTESAIVGVGEGAAEVERVRRNVRALSLWLEGYDFMPPP